MSILKTVNVYRRILTKSLTKNIGNSHRNKTIDLSQKIEIKSYNESIRSAVEAINKSIRESSLALRKAIEITVSIEKQGSSVR